MRTTINFDDRLFRELKRIAAKTGRTFKEVLEDSVREALARRSQRKPHRKVVLPTFKGGGLQPGVDLDNNASLLDLMEGHDPR